MKLEGVSRAHSDLQNLMAATEVGTLFLDTGLRIKRYTPPIADLFSVTPSDQGRPITDFTHRLRYTKLEADARKVLKDLAPVEREVESEQGLWFLMRLRPYRTLDDRIDGVVVTFVDVTERRAYAQRLQSMTDELDHRVKNLLARVMALVQISQRDAGSGADALPVLESRLKAMARTHTLLSQAQWSGVALGDICATELEPYKSRENVTIDGPNLDLNPEAAQTMTMVLHELATNAAKHGALSARGGKVRIAFAADKGMLRLDWEESNGPPVSAPDHKSYGLNIIENAIAREFGGSVDVDFAKTGLRCALHVPLDRVLTAS